MDVIILLVFRFYEMHLQLKKQKDCQILFLSTDQFHDHKKRFQGYICSLLQKIHKSHQIHYIMPLKSKTVIQQI